MKKQGRIIALITVALLLAAHYAYTEDFGFFRTIPAETPDRGILRMSNTSFYSDIIPNRVLVRNYGVKDTHIFSSISEFEIGITNSLALNGSIPFYADLFSQGSKSGKKSGAGDVVLGFRLSRKYESGFSGMSIGSRVRIPEQLGYGPEPLGVRTFSYGEFAYGIEAAAGFRFKIMEWNLSLSMLQYPNAAKQDSAFTTDEFYDTGFGYMGIGKIYETGLSEGIFQDQMHFSIGTSIPLKSWFSGLLECNTVWFLKTPKRENIVTLAPGIRVGKADGFSISVAMDYALSGPVPDKTFMFRIRIPTLSPRELKKILIKERKGDEIRSLNSLVALQNFSKSDITYLYEKDLQRSLQDNLDSAGFMELVPEKRIEQVFKQRELVPLQEKTQQLGVRLGANYLIETNIITFDIDRSPSFTVPFLLSFPKTTYSLSASSSVINLITGETHEMGVISANVTKPRGIEFFPTGPSSDIIYLSVPETRIAEKELINQWVHEFNTVIGKKIGIFGWIPKQTEIKGEKETEG